MKKGWSKFLMVMSIITEILSKIFGKSSNKEDNVTPN